MVRGRVTSTFNKITGKVVASLGYASTLVTSPVQSLLTPFKRENAHGIDRTSGTLSDFGGVGFEFDGYLKELGKFNPRYVHPYLQALMRRSPIPSISLLLINAALSERQYVVTGSTPGIESYHQRWIDRILPQLIRRASNAVWYGWQPFVIDYGVDDRRIVPMKAHDVSTYLSDVWVDPATRQFAGIQTNGANFNVHRSYAMTWKGDNGNYYGEGQSITVYPSWYAWSALLVWAMKYYQRSVDPIRIALVQNIKVPLSEKQRAKTGRKSVSLSEIMAHSLMKVRNGGTIAVPTGDRKGDIPPVSFEQLDFGDRADTWLKMISQQEQTQSIGCLILPSIGMLQTYGSVNSLDARKASEQQMRLFSQMSNELIIDQINECLLPTAHVLSGLDGPCPRLEGGAFQREQHESYEKIITGILSQPVPEIGPDGPTGRYARPVDMVKITGLLKNLKVPHHTMAEVARNLDEIGDQAPGTGGRQKDPYGERAEQRARGLDR